MVKRTPNNQNNNVSTKALILICCCCLEGIVFKKFSLFFKVLSKLKNLKLKNT